ncbi:hypothetical protein SDC9_147483 [bioreactor metagenome]|uniref:Uncharacterized protein n=1 Tax=bioreactor metagenome TaxID=1076179 RepID=A0A645EGM0_9ZZZZ
MDLIVVPARQKASSERFRGDALPGDDPALFGLLHNDLRALAGDADHGIKGLLHQAASFLSTAGCGSFTTVPASSASCRRLLQYSKPSCISISPHGTSESEVNSGPM